MRNVSRLNVFISVKALVGAISLTPLIDILHFICSGWHLEDRGGPKLSVWKVTYGFSDPASKLLTANLSIDNTNVQWYLMQVWRELL